MKRVMIIGGSGAGKSWLAARLAEVTGLPLIHVDKFYFHPGWKLRPREETQALVRTAAMTESWIIEGNNPDSFADRLARADHLIFIDCPTWLRLWRVVCRALRYFGRVRPDMADGCPENLSLKFLKLVLRYDRRYRKFAVQAMRDAPEHVTCIQLNSRRDVRAFAKKIARLEALGSQDLCMSAK